MNMTPANCIKGSELCKDNALQWQKDAQVLMRNGSYGHGLSAIMFAFEEYAKRYILYLCSNEPDDKTRERVLAKTFSSHRIKFAVITKLMRFGDRRISGGFESNLQNVLQRLLESADNFKDDREKGIYVNYVNDFDGFHTKGCYSLGWHTPNEVIKNELEKAISTFKETYAECEHVIQMV